MPLSTLRLTPRGINRKTQGQDGVRSLLSCRALSSPTTCRFSPAHPQVGFELATGRLTAQRLSSRNQTADGRLKSRKSEERTHAGSMITPQFMTFSIRYQVRLAQVKNSHSMLVEMEQPT